VGGLARRGEAEVGELQSGAQIRLAGQEHVRRLEVAMHHAARVRVRQCVEQTQQDAPQLVPARQGRALRQRPAGRPLHDQVRAPRLQPAVRLLRRRRRDLAVVEDHHDVRMVEPGDRADLVAERAEEPLVARALGGEHLHGDRQVALAVQPFPHLAHAAAADRREQVERAERDHARSLQRAAGAPVNPSGDRGRRRACASSRRNRA
jgi:hypothetical protein